MDAVLKVALGDYLDTLKDRLTEFAQETNRTANVRAIYSEAFWLRWACEQTENTDAFRRLEDCFHQCALSVDKRCDRIQAGRMLRIYLRRRDIYTSLMKREQFDYAELTQGLMGDLSKTEFEFEFIIPLHYLSFESDLIEFNSFSIERMRGEELDIILRTDLNRVFFPDLIVDLGSLPQMWVLRKKIRCATNAAFLSYYPGLIGDHPSLMSAEAGIPGEIHDLLLALSLFEWDESAIDRSIPNQNEFAPHTTHGEKYVDIRFVVVVNDNPFAFPGDHESKKGIQEIEVDEILDSATNEYRLGHDPLFLIDVAKELKLRQHVNRFMEQSQAVLAKSGKGFPGNARFFSGACSYFMRGMRRYELKLSGESLIWFVVAIECLLGDKFLFGMPPKDAGPTPTERLKRRANAILSRTGASCSEALNELYAVRCAIVHGSGHEDLTDWDHEVNYWAAFSADLAKRSIMYFLKMMAGSKEREGPFDKAWAIQTFDERNDLKKEFEEVLNHYRRAPSTRRPDR